MSNARQTSHRSRPGVKAQATAVSVVASIAVGAVFAGPALADPQQGGITPSGPSQQGGITPSAPAGPTSQTGVTPQIVPDPSPGPGLIPDPPQDAPYRPLPYYDGGTAPAPLRSINRTAPVQPIAAPEGTIRVGTLIEKKPAWMSDRDARSINRWAAYGEAKISQAWRALGVPDREADRRAAATILGVAIGGTTGATLAGVPAGIIGGVGGAAIGAGAGALIGFGVLSGPGLGPGAAIGAGVGAAVGAAALGIPAALAGAIAGGLLGGIAGQTYGGGDSKADPNQPLFPWQEPRVDSSPKVYRFTLPSHDAERVGLPSVDYTVNIHGDVTAQLGDNTFTWTGQQAQGPYAGLGSMAPAAQQTVNDWTRQAGDLLSARVQGLNIRYGPAATPPPQQAPQQVAPGRHRAAEPARQ